MIEKSDIKKRYATLPINRNRYWVTLIFLILTIALGIQFYLYIDQVTNNGPVTIQRPAGVEGFLPIGALMAWKHFVMTGNWDIYHPAGMVIFGFAILISLIFKKSFCSWFCPVGTVSEWLWKAGSFVMGKNIVLPGWLDIMLRSIKYLLLGFFVLIIAKMSNAQVSAFLQSPYYKIADVKMLHFFTNMSYLSLIVLTILLVLSFFIKNFWCRYACPYGALTGLVSVVSLFKIHRDSSTCIQCKKCNQACSHHITVMEKTSIFSPECSGCMDCIEACPVKGTLKLKPGNANPFFLSSFQISMLIIVIFFGLVYISILCGHWQSRIPAQELARVVHRLIPL